MKFDYIIVGSGLAGLYAAWKASLKGNVAVITKSLKTVYKQSFRKIPSM